MFLATRYLPASSLPSSVASSGRNAIPQFPGTTAAEHPRESRLTQTQAVEGNCLRKTARTYVSLILKQPEMRVVTSWGKELTGGEKIIKNQEGTFWSAGREPNFNLGGVTQMRHPLNCTL